MDWFQEPFIRSPHPVLEATRKTLERAARSIDDAQVRTRQMSRKLKKIEALPEERAQELLGMTKLPDETAADNE